MMSIPFSAPDLVMSLSVNNKRIFILSYRHVKIVIKNLKAVMNILLSSFGAYGGRISPCGVLLHVHFVEKINISLEFLHERHVDIINILLNSKNM